MDVDKLLLQTGEDIPFGLARVTIHQPKLREISLIGESTFHKGSHFILIDKNDLSDEGKVDLENQSNFNIFMSVMNSHDKVMRHRTDTLMVLTLLFPEAKIKIEADKILLQIGNFSSSLNEQNFSEFQSIVSQMFCLGEEGDKKYNPQDKIAKRIADKLAKRDEKLAKKKGQDINKISIYSKFIDILSVGLKMDKNVLSNYTVYQLRTTQQRFLSQEQYDIYIKAKLAGAQDLEEVENWME